jgi:hypothetical protein
MDDDLLAMERIDDYRSICISELAHSTVCELEAGHLGGDRGLFIYEVDESPDGGGINILGKAASWEAACRLMDIWRGTIRHITATA